MTILRRNSQSKALRARWCNVKIPLTQKVGLEVFDVVYIKCTLAYLSVCLHVFFIPISALWFSESTFADMSNPFNFPTLTKT